VIEDGLSETVRTTLSQAVGLPLGLVLLVYAHSPERMSGSTERVRTLVRGG